MTDQTNNYSWFLDNHFGIGLKTGELLTKINSHEKRNELIDVANRLWFFDLLRYRTTFSPGNVVPDEINTFLNNEVLALQQFLLFTCIDALSGKMDFITFPDWLSIRKSKTKNKYNINDEDIKIAVGTDNLNETDNFRFAAFRVFQKCYQPHYGNKISINKFLLELPESLKRILAEIYIIVKTTKPFKYFVFDQNGNPIRTVDDWDIEQKKWVSLDLDLKINEIANYYYKILRNPYTHNAKTTLQKPLYFHSIFTLEDSSLVYDYYPDSKFLVRFQQKSVEKEILITRLIVIIGWLSKLGFTVNDELINKFRSHQIRREYMFYSIKEMEHNQRLIDIYKNETYTELTKFHPKLSLEKINFTSLLRLKSHLQVDTPLESEFIKLIDSLIIKLQTINNLIEEQNQKYISKCSFVPTDEECKVLKQTMPVAFGLIKQNISKENFESQCVEILEFLNELSEWILE
jgi:hypothetical protein